MNEFIEYAPLTLSGNLAAGEVLNIGVVAHDRTSDATRFVFAKEKRLLSRLCSAFPQLPYSGVKALIHNSENVLKKATSDLIRHGEKWESIAELEDWLPSQVQVGAPAYAPAGGSLDALTLKLFRRIADPFAPSEPNQKGDSAGSALYRLLKKGIGNNLFEAGRVVAKPTIRSGSSMLSMQVDAAYKNGSLNLVNALDFSSEGRKPLHGGEILGKAAKQIATASFTRFAAKKADINTSFTVVYSLGRDSSMIDQKAALSLLESESTIRLVGDNQMAEFYEEIRDSAQSRQELMTYAGKILQKP